MASPPLRRCRLNGIESHFLIVIIKIKHEPVTCGVGKFGKFNPEPGKFASAN
jgi:hypothetical protein